MKSKDGGEGEGGRLIERGGGLINYPPLKRRGANRGFTVNFFREGTVGDIQQVRDVSKFGTNDNFLMDLACEPQNISGRLSLRKLTSANPSGKTISVTLNLNTLIS